jgi:hypothetical protein
VKEGDRVITRSARGDGVIGEGTSFSLSPYDPITLSPRKLRLIGAGAALVVLLAGCASSPEASRVPGELGADPGNHGNPVVLLEPSERFDRVYYEVPYDGPAAASEDTSQS